MPTYSFDETNPLNTAIVSQYPANERAARAALSSWAVREHAMTGRHKLPNGTTSARNALADRVVGMWFYNTDTRSIEICTDASGGGTWATYGAMIGPGFMQAVGFTTVPTGWLSCNGASLSRMAYAALFAAIGTNYGNVDGDTFNLPSLGGAVPVGYVSGGDADGEYGTIQAAVYGEKKSTLLAANIPRLVVAGTAHTHMMNQQAGYQEYLSGTSRNAILNGTGGATATGSTELTGMTVGDAAPTKVDNRQVSLVVHWIIKT